MTNAVEAYHKYVAKVGLLRAQQKNRPLKALQVLGDYAQHYSDLTGILELGKVSKTHVIGLMGAMGNLSRSRSALGLFSDDFEKVTGELAIMIVALTLRNPPLLAVQLVQWWLELTAMAVVGAVELARQATEPKKEVYYDPEFRDELLQILIFSSDYPQYWFYEMGDAVGVEKQKIPLFGAIFEALAIVLALTACAKDVDALRTEWVENLVTRLQRNVDKILEALDMGESSLEGSGERAYLEEIRLSLERRNIEGLIQTWLDLLEASGYSRELFKGDLDNMKTLFFHFKEAYQASKKTKSAQMHMVG
jgi:hypothetical protein